MIKLKGMDPEVKIESLEQFSLKGGIVFPRYIAVECVVCKALVVLNFGLMGYCKRCKIWNLILFRN